MPDISPLPQVVEVMHLIQNKIKMSLVKSEKRLVFYGQKSKTLSTVNFSMKFVNWMGVDLYDLLGPMSNERSLEASADDGADSVYLHLLETAVLRQAKINIMNQHIGEQIQKKH